MNVEDFARKLYDLIQNTDVHPSVRTHSVRVQDATFDICFRRSLNIMVTFEVEAPSEDTFQERVAANIRDAINRPLADIHLFHDRSDSNLLEHVGSYTTSDLRPMIAKIRELRWSHAYCPAANRLFNFVSQDNEVVDDIASNTEHYLGKYHRWLRSRNAPSEGPWYMFQESYTWHTSQFLALFGSLNNVRAEIRRRFQTSPQCRWWHAWCEKTNQVVNFYFADGKMASKVYVPDEAFLARARSLCEPPSPPIAADDMEAPSPPQEV
jgi:hypothetical protein